MDQRTEPFRTFFIGGAILIAIVFAYGVAYLAIGDRAIYQHDSTTYNCYDSKWEAVFFVPAMKIESLVRHKDIRAVWEHPKSETIDPIP